MKRVLFFATAIVGLLYSASFGASYGGGTGTSEDPYLIYTAEQMNTIGANSGDWSKYFKLMADIDMSAYTGTQYNIIGNATTKFMGTFDGNNHTISNLTYSTTSFVSYVGLFGYTVAATIKDLGVENINFSGVLYYGGGLAGYHYLGSITNCYCTGVISSSSSYIGGLAGYKYGGTISNCYSTLAINLSASFSERYAGGLVGYLSNGDIIRCCSRGSVSSFITTSSAVSAYTGGLVGYQYKGSILYCYSTCDVIFDSEIYLAVVAPAGGLAGELNGCSVSNCYSIGDVGYYCPYSVVVPRAGGLVGSHGDSVLTNCYSTGAILTAEGYSISSNGLVGGASAGPVTACFWDMETSGQTTSKSGVGKTTDEMKTLTTFTNAGWDFTEETANGTSNIWRMCADGVDYPRLNWEFSEGDFVCIDVVDIGDLDYFIERWLLTNCTSVNNYCGGADMNSSGVVDMADLAILAGNWLEGV